MTALRILLVEDEPWKASTIRRLLWAAATMGGVEVSIHHASDMRGAEFALAHERFAAIVTDWHLPLQAGQGVAREAGYLSVLAADRLSLPCLIISGETEPTDFLSGPTLRWAAADGWTDSLRWLLARAMDRPVRSLASVREPARGDA